MAVTTTSTSGYAPVNGLQMYYEMHGFGQPTVLIHGAFSAIGTSFGAVLPTLAAGRQVIGVELQGHGRTADVDRPFNLGQFADDVAALLEHLGVQQADVVGYSIGAAVAIELGLRHPRLVRKLVLISGSYNRAGLHPGLLEGIEMLQPEMMVGSPWHDEYLRIAPHPEAFPLLVDKIKALDRNLPDIPEATMRTIEAPLLLIVGDSDIVRPEHAVEMFRLYGGGVAGDNVGLPKSQLAILPGTTHVTIVSRGEWLSSMIAEFLDKAQP